MFGMVKDVEWYRRNAEEMHPLHFQVGELFNELLKDSLMTGYSLMLDEACGGAQRVPLFVSSEKSRKNEFCNVDFLVIHDGDIRAIVEIEESNVKPVHVFGKFLASAVSRFYIHDYLGGAMGYGEDVVFIQFVDTSKLKRGRSSKVEQWRNICDSIRSVVPLNGSRIARYELFDVNVEEIRDAEMREKLKIRLIELIG